MFCLIKISLLVILFRSVHGAPIETPPPPPPPTTTALPVTFTLPVTEIIPIFTFDGVYYDDDAEYIQKETAKLFKSKPKHCGIGEYFRCIMRTPYMQYFCVGTMEDKVFYSNMYSFCEFEYKNCLYFDKSKSYTTHEFGHNVFEIVDDGLCKKS